MTTNSPNRDAQALIERIGVALKQFTNGRASMHVPPLDTDVDIVLADCEKMLKSLTPPAQLLRPVELPQSFYGVVQDGKSVMLPAADGQWLNKTAVIEALRQQGYEVKND